MNNIYKLDIKAVEELANKMASEISPFGYEAKYDYKGLDKEGSYNFTLTYNGIVYRKETAAINHGPCLSYGATRFFVGDTEVLYWNLNPETGKVEVIGEHIKSK